MINNMNSYFVAEKQESVIFIAVGLLALGISVWLSRVHQMTQVVDLYRGAFKTLHYKRLIWGSREGFLMLNADRICECSCVMVDKPLSGADLFKTIF